MKPFIHFTCLYGVEYELDLLPWWGPYYANIKFDSYKIFLHKEIGEIDAKIISDFHNLGFSTEIVRESHGNGVLRGEVLKHYVKSLPPDDFLVAADADEFQISLDSNTLPYGPPDYQELLTRYDVLSGFMIDRYSDALLECCMDPFLQYPFEEPHTGEILKSFSPPFLRKTKWPPTRRTKILAARAGYNVSFDGSHCLLTIPQYARVLDGFKVLHFAWRESARRKIAIKSYYTEDNLKEVYDGNPPEDMLNMLGRINTLFYPEKMTGGAV